MFVFVYLYWKKPELLDSLKIMCEYILKEYEKIL